MERPVLSYCVPAYNVEDHIGDCISSILSEGTDDFEIIIVDDASTDSTAEIAARLCRQDPRIKLVRHPYNRGLPCARNTALGEVTGKFIRHVDSDDLVEKGSSGHLLSVIGNSDVARGSSMAFHMPGMAAYPMDWANGGIGNFTVDNLWESDFFRRNALGYVWLYLYRSDFLRDIGNPLFCAGLSILEDDIYNAAVLPRARTIAVTDQVVTLYRTGGMSSSRSWTFRQYIEQASALSVVSDRLRHGGDFLDSYLNRKAGFVIQKAKIARSSGLNFEQFCAYAEIIRSVYLSSDIQGYSGSSNAALDYKVYSDEDVTILLQMVRGEIDTLYSRLES